MKILIVITKADEIGGAQTHVLDLSKGLTARGYDVSVLVGEEGLFVQRLINDEIDVNIEPCLVRKVDLFKDVQFIFKLREILKRDAPDLVHLHSSKAGLLGRIAAWSLGVPVVFTVHGWSFAEGISEKTRKLYSFLERITSRFLTRIITVSEHDKKLALEYNICEPSKIDVIHNGIPELPFLKPCRNNKVLKIIMVARFSEQKDHKTLFYALERIKDLGWQLDLVGKGKLFDDSINLAKNLGIISRINFLGERSDVEELLLNSDIFCLISNWEGFPISIIEAMRFSLPIIASDVGGVKEAVEDGYNGYLISRNEDKLLAERMRKLITSPLLREQFGNASFYKYTERFTSTIMLDKTINTYTLAINTLKEKKINCV